MREISIILPNIHAIHGSRFEAVADLSEIIQNPNLNYYVFTRDDKVSKPVEEMTNLLVEKNVTITDAKGCLSGTSVTFRVKLFNTDKAIMYSGDRLGSISLDNI